MKLIVFGGVVAHLIIASASSYSFQEPLQEPVPVYGFTDPHGEHHDAWSISQILCSLGYMIENGQIVQSNACLQHQYSWGAIGSSVAAVVTDMPGTFIPPTSHEKVVPPPESSPSLRGAPSPPPCEILENPTTTLPPPCNMFETPTSSPPRPTDILVNPTTSPPPPTDILVNPTTSPPPQFNKSEDTARPVDVKDLESRCTPTEMEEVEAFKRSM